MTTDIAGKAVLVTGASTGIGAAVARGFAARGARVGVHYNANRDAAEAVVTDILAAGGDAHLLGGDLTRPKIVAQVVAEADKALGGIDVLINNAGSMLGRIPTLEMDDAHFHEVIQLNCWSTFAVTRAVVPIMRARGGAIINVSSIAARNGGGGGAVLYASAKGFVSTLTRGLAKELIADGIRVNAVSPGTIDTPFHARYSNTQQLDAARAAIPMGRLGTAHDCVGAFLFLASTQASGYVTGQIIEVNGGQLML